MTMHSGIYEGVVRHRRFEPVHDFRMPLFMMYLDLDELASVFRGSLAWSTSRPALGWFRRQDFIADADGNRSGDLRVAVGSRVEQAIGWKPNGPIRMLAHLRYFGYIFNPVSFYYCFDPSGTKVEAIVAEITNTPWKQRHAYVLDARGVPAGRSMRFGFKKAFHVSPLMPMDMNYRWGFSAPAESPGGRIGVHMELEREGRQTFDATLSLTRREISPAALRRTLLRHPVMTAGVIARIHWEALRTWRKGAKFHPNPESVRRRETKGMERIPTPPVSSTGVTA
jgi:DUF1365 family protein